jgi:uncharacterized membrane protein YjgN (DUF898 family)
MSKKPTRARIALQQAKSYESMAWLGLILLPLAYIFGILSINKVHEAELYDLTSDEKKLAKTTTSSAKNIMITISCLYLLAIIGLCVAINTK